MKRFRIFLIIVVLINMLVISSYAFTFRDILGGASSFNGGVNTSTPANANTQFAPMIKALVQAGVAIGTVVAIVVGIIIGIKFMVDGADGKAELKTMLTPYLIACAVLFGGYGIWVIVVKIMESIFY